MYSTNKIETKQDCEILIRLAEKAKKELAFQESTLERKQNIYSLAAIEIQVDRASTVAEISSLQSILAGLPDGDTKDDNTIKLTRLQLKLVLLDERNKSNGIIAILEKEFELDQIEKQMDVSDDFIAALQARKAALTDPPQIVP